MRRIFFDQGDIKKNPLYIEFVRPIQSTNRTKIPSMTASKLCVGDSDNLNNPQLTVNVVVRELVNFRETIPIFPLMQIDQRSVKPKVALERLVCKIGGVKHF